MINTIKRVALICCLLQPAILIAEESATDAADSANLPCAGKTTVAIENNALTVEIAKDPRDRHFGLMFREALGADCGMLYLYENSQRRIFTMRNTAMPLDVAFITADGIVTELATMDIDDGLYASSTEARYVLEVNAGWFQENNLQPGSQISFNTGDALQPLSSLADY